MCWTVLRELFFGNVLIKSFSLSSLLECQPGHRMLRLLQTALQIQMPFLYNKVFNTAIDSPRRSINLGTNCRVRCDRNQYVTENFQISYSPVPDGWNWHWHTQTHFYRVLVWLQQEFLLSFWILSNLTTAKMESTQLFKSRKVSKTLRAEFCLTSLFPFPYPISFFFYIGASLFAILVLQVGM